MKKSLIFVASVLSILFISCGKSSKNSRLENFDMVHEAAIMNDSYIGASKASMKQTAANGVYADEAVVYEMEDNIEIPTSEIVQKLIKSGFFQISVPTFDDIEIKVQDYAKLYGGYITNTYLSENHYSAEIKIPSLNFENAMNNAGSLGEVKNRSQNAVDVTDEYYDLESRINTKRILKEKLESYLKQAGSIKDLMEIEKQLNNVVSELESMEGRMKRLSSQIDYSTISISATLPTGFVNTGYDWPDIKESFRKMGINIVNFFAKLLVVIIYIIIYGIPIVAIGAVFFWLLFGKIGLLVKLYKKIKSK